MDEINDNFYKFWNSLGEKPNSTIRFFDRTDYYTVHFEDAEMLARSFYKSKEVLKYFQRGNVSSPYMNIKKSNSDGVFRYLLIANPYKVEIYKNNKPNNDSPWLLDFTVTPGNIEKYQDILFNDIDIPTSNSLLALNIKKINDDYRIYLGFCDLDNGVFLIGSFEESYNGYEQLANLSSALFQLNCRECLVPSNDSRPELLSIKNTIQNAGLLLTEVKKSLFFTETIFDSITKLICKTNFNNENTILKLSETEGMEAVGCLAAVIMYLDLLNDISFLNVFDIQTFKLDNFMRIGEQCSRALNILPSPNDMRKCDNLYGLLNACRTANGERLLMQWLKQPLMNVHLINNRLDIVESLLTDGKMRNLLYETYLRHSPDLQRISKRIQRNKGTLQDIYKLFTALQLSVEIRTLLSNHKGQYKHVIESEIISVISEVIKSAENFKQTFSSIFDFEAVKNHDFRIRCDVDDTLLDCDNKMKSLITDMDEEYTKISKKIGLESSKQVKFESSNNLGYFMRVSRKDEHVLRNKKYITILETLKDGVKFHSQSMTPMNDAYLEHRKDYEIYEKDIIETMVKVTNENVGTFHKLSSILAKLDVLCSLAITVSTAPKNYVRPRIVEHDKKILKFDGCRHPLVEMQCNISYISNDIFFDEDKTFHIITGPNMGGKSTYIRSIGLCCVMAQIGSFVPCDKAEISLCDRVMTRIGAGDCQLTGVSTFMAEMLDISWILKTATPSSLIIIDELGRGTSTFDGFGLAWAISEHIASVLKAFSVFATHFHELTDLDKTHDNVKNLHVSAQTIDNELVFMYKVEDGPSMKSFGIEVAKASGLPDCTIEYAKEKLAEYESFKEDEIDHLENKRKALMEFCEQDLDDQLDLTELINKL